MDVGEYPENYIVYMYRDVVNRAAYIGLTNNRVKRDYEHRHDVKDSLYKYCIERGTDVPEMEVLKDDLTSVEARRYETSFWYRYRDEGWTMINSERTLGFMGHGPFKWTRDVIVRYVRENPQIKSRTDLERDNPTVAHRAARYKGLLDELFGEKLVRGKYSEDEIRKFVAEHPGITRKQLSDGYSGIYKAAKKFGILDEIIPDVKSVKWTEESIRRFLYENPGIKTRTQLKNVNGSAYAAAWRLGILDELFGDIVYSNLKYTREFIVSYIMEHPEIRTRKAFEKDNRSMYMAAYRYDGLLDELFGEKQTKSWDEESIERFIRENNVTKRKQLEKLSTQAYRVALKLGILDRMIPKK